MPDIIKKGKLKRKISSTSAVILHPETEADVTKIAALAASAELTKDKKFQSGKNYYIRTVSSAGAGYLNDGNYLYTLATSIIGDAIPDNTYWELSQLGYNDTVESAIQSITSNQSSVSALFEFNHITVNSLYDLPNIGNSRTLYIVTTDGYHSIYKWNDSSISYELVANNYNEVGSINGGNSNE